ncbi:MAG TPA: hypothetical protein VND15_01520 [Candidatus Acidoferrales bacterium]|nr:hypothetical protein [Candidatus Acidoferrales bacterium]
MTLKNHPTLGTDTISLRGDSLRPSGADIEAFIRGDRKLTDTLFDLSLKLHGLPEEQRSAAISGYRNELIGAKISRTNLLYTGRWFMGMEEIVAFADEFNNGERRMSKALFTQTAPLLPKRVSLTASREVAEAFAAYGDIKADVRQFGVVLALDARKVEYYHIDTYIVQAGLRNNPNAVAMHWADEEEVRVNGLRKESVIGVDIHKNGTSILSSNSFPSEHALMARINAIVGK